MTGLVEILHPHDDADRIRHLRNVDGYALVDGWESALEDLHKLDQYSTTPIDYDPADLDRTTRYIAYPWRRTIVRLPEASVFHRLRTARNRFLITDDEQRSWTSGLIAIAGLSVGGSVLSVCALTGARRLRIADPDTLGPSNLNRLVGSVCDLGVPKTTLAYRRVLEADPYAEVEAFPGGFHPSMAERFIGGGAIPRARVLVEEMDDLAMKVRIRHHARDAQVPVIMVTDNGDDVILDIERFDLEPDRPLFHGRAGDVETLTDDELRDPERRVEIAGTIVGDDVADRLKVALGEVGKTIPSWPQLGTAATLAGVVGALAARKVICGTDLPSGRHHVRVSDLG
ncbi:ThiF family adenylyltransferase [Gordonia sp. NPDC062954]|uniref:ThiF family adenylyltransferase n=1 Tax=Gordonia sp. NPDC062954 TaxID=3364003 RepID=UPI0037CA3BEF